MVRCKSDKIYKITQDSVNACVLSVFILKHRDLAIMDVSYGSGDRRNSPRALVTELSCKCKQKRRTMRKEPRRTLVLAGISPGFPPSFGLGVDGVAGICFLCQEPELWEVFVSHMVTLKWSLQVLSRPSIFKEMNNY